MIIKVSMVNCQSWKNGGFTLSTDRLNTIVADNGTGKSVFFKMLKIVSHPKYYSREERANLIRHNAEFAAIYFEFDDGSMACTRVYPTYTLYLYRPTADSDIKTSYEPDPEMLKKAELLTDNQTQFCANIVDADQDLLLVNSNLKCNFSLFKMLAESEDLESVRQKLDDIVSHMINPLSSVSERCATLQGLIDDSTYCDVKTRELELDILDKAECLLFCAIDIANGIGSMSEAMKNKVDYDFLFQLLDVCEKAEQITIENLIVPKAPLDLSEELNLLDCLSEMQLQELSIMKKPADVFEEINLLETVEGIHLEYLFIGRKPADVEDCIDLLEKIQELASTMTLRSSYALSINSLGNELQKVKKELKDARAILECQIYGRVVYDGEKCVPCDD